MARPDTVYSLFGLKTPQEVAAENLRINTDILSSAETGFGRAGAGIGIGLRRLFGGADPEMEQAQALEEIAREYQPGNLQSMATTYSRLQEAGAPAETLQRLSADITARSAEVNEQAQARRAQSAAVEFVSRANPELGQLVASGAMAPGEAIEAVRKAGEPIKVGDVLVNYDPQRKEAAVVFDARKRTPQTTYRILTEEQKRAAGINAPGVYQQSSTGQISRIAGADIPQMGSIPQGYQVVVDTDEQNRPLISMQPIPGSQAARDEQKAEEAVRAGRKAKFNKFESIVGPAIDTAIEIAEDPENWATGKSGAFVDNLGRLTGGIASAGTSRLALSEQLTTVRANIGFDRLQKMRDESPTGGALGQVALQELYALQSSIAPLNPNMTSEELVAGLNKVKDTYRKAVEAVANDLTDEQLRQEGLQDLIPFRTQIRNPDGSYTDLAPAEDEFDISVLPQDIQDGWDSLDEETKAMLTEAYKQ